MGSIVYFRSKSKGQSLAMPTKTVKQGGREVEIASEPIRFQPGYSGKDLGGGAFEPDKLKGYFFTDKPAEIARVRESRAFAAGEIEEFDPGTEARKATLHDKINAMSPSDAAKLVEALQKGATIK